MIIQSSPLETLAAFALAYLGGIVCGLALTHLARCLRKEALRELAAA